MMPHPKCVATEARQHNAIFSSKYREIKVLGYVRLLLTKHPTRKSDNPVAFPSDLLTGGESYMDTKFALHSDPRPFIVLCDERQDFRSVYHRTDGSHTNSLITVTQTLKVVCQVLPWHPTVLRFRESPPLHKKLQHGFIPGRLMSWTMISNRLHNILAFILRRNSDRIHKNGIVSK